jgi:hypothetical protein
VFFQQPNRPKSKTPSGAGEFICTALLRSSPLAFLFVKAPLDLTISTSNNDEQLAAAALVEWG